MSTFPGRSSDLWPTPEAAHAAIYHLYTQISDHLADDLPMCMTATGLRVLTRNGLTNQATPYISATVDWMVWREVGGRCGVLRAADNLELTTQDQPVLDALVASRWNLWRIEALQGDGRFRLSSRSGGPDEADVTIPANLFAESLVVGVELLGRIARLGSWAFFVGLPILDQPDEHGESMGTMFPPEVLTSITEGIANRDRAKALFIRTLIGFIVLADHVYAGGECTPDVVARMFADDGSDLEYDAFADPDDVDWPAPVRIEPKTGRNDPCPCGSGKKFKKCCGK